VLVMQSRRRMGGDATSLGRRHEAKFFPDAETPPLTGYKSDHIRGGRGAGRFVPPQFWQVQRSPKTQILFIAVKDTRRSHVQFSLFHEDMKEAVAPPLVSHTNTTPHHNKNQTSPEQGAQGPTQPARSRFFFSLPLYKYPYMSSITWQHLTFPSLTARSSRHQA